MANKQPMWRPPIADVMRHYGYDIPPLRAGGWTKVRCPLPHHDDTRPSASVNASTNRWHCMACDVMEDSIDVIMREEGCSVVGARQIADERFGGGGHKVREELGEGGQVPLFKGNTQMGGGGGKARGLF